MTFPKINPLWTIVIALAISGSGFAGKAQLGHYLTSGETTERSKENEAKLAPILDILEKLGDRAIAEDAAEEERAKLCRMGIIDDKKLCGEVGEEVAE